MNQVLDLRGIPCPINFVHTKLRLEEMNEGEVLEVYLDKGEPFSNVSRSIKEEGHEIIRVDRKEEFCLIVIKKGGRTNVGEEG